MLLRRLTDHVKAQNWTAVALDFFIVVAGILIAFQISAWSDARRDRAHAARYRVELAEDLRADIAEIEETRAAALLRVAAAERLLEEIWPDYERPATLNDAPGVEAVDLPDLSDFPSDMVHGLALSVRVLDGAGRTYDELVATGNLGVLNDRAIERALTDYYSEFSAEQDGDAINRHLFHRMADRYIDLGVSPIEAMPQEDFVALARDDNALQGHLKAARDFGVWQSTRLDALKERAERVLERIDDDAT